MMVMKQTLKILKTFCRQLSKCLENQNKLMPFLSKKPVIQVNPVKLTITLLIMLSVIQKEAINIFSESCEWGHLSEFEDVIIDLSENDWLP